MIKLRHLAAASAVVLTLAVAVPPASAQWIVYDPTNFAPERADRRARAAADQQPDHDADTTRRRSLINQARNLANLPMSTLHPASVVDRPDPISCSSQAQNIAFNVQRIEQAYLDELRFGRRHRFDHRHGRQRADAAGRTPSPPSRTA